MPSNLFDIITSIIIILLPNRWEIFSKTRFCETDKRDFESCFQFETFYTKFSAMKITHNSIEKMQKKDVNKKKCCRHFYNN